MDSSYFIYILYSSNADKYYVGYTTDYLKRVEDHNSQEFFITYTSKHRPWVLAAVFSVGVDESIAVSMERYIKKQKSRRLIELLIDPDFVPSGELAQLVIPYVRDAAAGLISGSLVQSLSRYFGIQEEEQNCTRRQKCRLFCCLSVG